MKIIGHEDVPNVRAEGENRSDPYDVEDITLGMRGLYASSERALVQTPITSEIDSSSTSRTLVQSETTPADDPIWKEVLEWCP